MDFDFWAIIDFNWSYEEQQALTWECKQLIQYYDL